VLSIRLPAPWLSNRLQRQAAGPLVRAASKVHCKSGQGRCASPQRWHTPKRSCLAEALKGCPRVIGRPSDWRCVAFCADDAQVRLLNGSATCNMRMGRWEEAEGQLMEAFEKDAKNPDTLANLVTVSLHLGKPTSRFVGCVPSHFPAAAQ
jgi:Coatomer epsilon subunit